MDSFKVSDLLALHHSIVKSYLSKDTAKWTTIAQQLSDNSLKIMAAYRYLQTNNLIAIELNYETAFDTIQSQLTVESNVLKKISLIVLSLHFIIYQLMVNPLYYLFCLDGQTEMNAITEPIVYYIHLSAKNEQNIYFHAFMLVYALESLFTKNLYVGVDFEFTVRNIELIQLNFEHSVDKRSVITMINPNELEPQMLTDYVQLIMCNPAIKKILHGSDSQDIPYIYKQLLHQNNEQIIQFNQSLIDTRFLCEYYKLNLENSSNNRCSIYDIEADRSAIYYFKLISKETQDKLSTVIDQMGPPADIVWNIHRMPKAQTYYAQYDVLFLKYFYYQIIYTATTHCQSAIEKKLMMDLYKLILPQLTQFVYLENNLITDLTVQCKLEVDNINNYFIKTKTGVVKMIDLYNQMSTPLIISSVNVSVDQLMKVNHFRKVLVVILKRLLYGHLSRYGQLYKNKNTRWNDQYNNQFIFHFFDTLKMNCLMIIFKEVSAILETRVREFCVAYH